MRQDKTFDMFGLQYRTRQFTAVPALGMLEKDGDLSPAEMLANTQIKTKKGWIKLDTREGINGHVFDAAGILAPRVVLNALLEIVNDFNFGFLYTWQGVRVPTRLQDEAKQVASDNSDPMVSSLISGDVATLRELEEYYSLEDAFKMFDIMTAKGVNAALSQEYAAAKSKKR